VESLSIATYFSKLIRLDIRYMSVTLDAPLPRGLPLGV